MKIIVIIQARMGSSRLPGKILKPLGEHDVLTYVVERCKKISRVEDVIVATSVLAQDDLVESWCNERGIACFRGSEEDVLDRYVQCAKQYNPDYVIRVTADCPFIDYEMASEIVQLMEKEKVDIIDVKGELPRGLTVEMLSYPTLLYIDEHGLEERHREHVTYYAYEHKNNFTRVDYHPSANRCFPQLRITLDTEDDYTLCKEVANHFQDLYTSSAEVIQFLLEHPEIAKLNEHIEQKPVI